MTAVLTRVMVDGSGDSVCGRTTVVMAGKVDEGGCDSSDRSREVEDH